MHRKLFLFLAVLYNCITSGCSYYEIPQPELQRLQTRIQKKEMKRVNLEELFKDHQFPELKDYFFYVLYHLEQQQGDYLVNKQNLVEFFEKRDLNSTIPLDDLEKIVRENDYLTIYTGGFSQRLPGTSGQLSLSASEDLCLYSQALRKKPGHRILNLSLGSLTIELNFPLNLIYSARPHVKKVQIYDQGTNVIFYCRCFYQGELRNTRNIYHSKDGSIRTQDGWEDKP